MEGKGNFSLWFGKNRRDAVVMKNEASRVTDFFSQAKLIKPIRSVFAADEQSKDKEPPLLENTLNIIPNNMPQSQNYDAVKSSDPVAAPVTSQLSEVFEKYCSKTIDGEPVMTHEDFIINYLQIIESEKVGPEVIWLLGSIADTNKQGYITFPEFQAFEATLRQPDALYQIAFLIFDSNGNGTVNYDEFIRVIQNTLLHKVIPFDFDSEFMQLHFGRKMQRPVTYTELTEILHDFHENYAIHAFKHYDRSAEGFISAVDFHQIMTSIRPHLLSDFVRDNLIIAASSTKKSKKVSFSYFMAFNYLLNNMELIKKIYLNITNQTILNTSVTKEEFLNQAQIFSNMTPMEIDILFHLASLRRHDGRLTYDDLTVIAPERVILQSFSLTNIKAVDDPSQRGPMIQVLESMYRFVLGSVGGAIGAATVYPIDLVKTRMQNQRSTGYMEELMYKNSWDCFKKVLKFEGIKGLYRGLVPQLVGVAPEKAIKLTMNDFVRDKFLSNGGHIPLWGEMLAGGTAGASQVMFTNPLEIVKIRLQVAGEVASGPQVGAVHVIKDLGFKGLYKGTRACLLRDVPFSAIYFPAYAHFKQSFADKNGHNSPLTLLVAAAMAGAPAACLTTPADVIKTRLQVAARAGQTTYTGLTDCAVKIMREEGVMAFWKGAGARMMRSSPQFGVTLMTYELLQRLFKVDFGGVRPTGENYEVPATPQFVYGRSDNPDHVGGFALAKATFLGMENKFGLYFPKYAPKS